MEVFVFGSNLAGRHGKGAALHALHHYGAVYGNGRGAQGRSYAIPTKDADLRTLALNEIEQYVQEFIAYASLRPRVLFLLTAVGCGLAGYFPTDIAPMFRDAPKNVRFPKEFLKVLMPEASR